MFKVASILRSRVFEATNSESTSRVWGLIAESTRLTAQQMHGASKPLWLQQIHQFKNFVFLNYFCFYVKTVLY
jgi:hypothetical protein